MPNYTIISAPADITSGFRTPSRPDHNGVDLAPIPRGSKPNIRCIADGSLLLLRPGSPTAGNYVEVIHLNGYVSRYLHLDSITPALKTGQAVKAGAVLGVMGTTVQSTGVHLHFEIRTVREQDSRYAVDPMPYLEGRETLCGTVSPEAATKEPVSTNTSTTVTKTGSNQTLKTGQEVVLDKALFYSSATATVATAIMSGTYYVYDETVINGRMRVTNKAANVGRSPVGMYVTGWVGV